MEFNVIENKDFQYELENNGLKKFKKYLIYFI